MSTAAPNIPQDTIVTRSPFAERYSMSWRTWPDWINTVIGLYLAFATMWTVGAPTAWFVGLGVVIAAVGFLALLSAYSQVPEWVQMLVGAVTALSPWLGGFTAAPAAAWTAGIAGVAVIVFAILGLRMQRTAVR